VQTVSADSQCRQSVQTVSADSQCRQSEQTVSADSQCRQSVQTVRADSQSGQPERTVSADSQFRQSSYWNTAIGEAHYTFASQETISEPDRHWGGRRYPAALKRSLDPSVSQRSGPVETCQGTDVFLDIYTLISIVVCRRDTIT
jgi:hypothetical protein